MIWNRTFLNKGTYEFQKQQLLLLEKKIKKSLDNIIRCPPKDNNFIQRPKKQRKPQYRVSNCRFLDRIRELDHLSASMRPTPRLESLSQLKSLNPSPRPSSPTFSPNVIISENVKKLTRFVTGGYIQQDEDFCSININSVEQTQQRFCSLEKMYHAVLGSDQFQKSFQRQIQPPKDSFANYVYRCEKQTLLRGDQKYRKVKTQGEEKVIVASQEKARKIGKKKNNITGKKFNNRDHGELLESLKLIKRNITERKNKMFLQA